MTRTLEMNRRDFLTTTAVVGGGMVLGFWLPSPADAQVPAAHQPWYRDATAPEINAWIAIAPDDTVTIRIGKIEMGQGVITSCSMIIAEELQCDWSKVRWEFVSANRNAREKAPEWTMTVPGKGNTDPNGGGAQNIVNRTEDAGVYRHIVTNSSSGVRTGRYYMQLAGAEARERLLLAAATTWGVPVSELTAKDSVITHAKSKRRTTYGAVAAKAAQTPLPDPARTVRMKGASEFRLIGTEQKNLDTVLKSTGRAMYAIDVRLPGMLYAAVKACPVWGGTVKSHDESRVRNMPGVVSVVRMENRPGQFSGAVAVVADSWWRAKQALDAMPIEWNYGADVVVNSPALYESHQAALQQPGDLRMEHGNMEAAMRGAAKVVEATYSVPYVAHACPEPSSVTAIVTADRIDMWTGTQQPDRDIGDIARRAQLPAAKVYLHQMFLGGGYGITNEGGGLANEAGGRSDLNMQAFEIAKTLGGRPVKVLWSREEDWGFGVRPRPMGVAILRAGLDGDGWPVALEVRTSGQHYGGDQQYRGLTAFPYFVPNYHYTTHDQKTHVPCIQRRATGSSTNAFYAESFIDELAHAAGKDPYRYRRDLLSRNPNAGGIGGFTRVQRDEWIQALDRVAKLADWGSSLPRGWGRGIAIDDRRRGMRQTETTYMTVVAEVHTVEVTPRGELRLRRADVVHDQGFSLINPLSTRKQIEGQLAWGYDDTVHHAVTLKEGRAVETNYDTLPVSRLGEYPREVNIAFMKTDKWIYGTGEESIPQVAPAICNAVFMATGKRLRSLPLKNHDLSWASS